MSVTRELTIGVGGITVEDVVDVARDGRRVVLSGEPSFNERLARGATVIERRLQDGVPTYGVNTGFGASVRNAVPMAQALALAENLPRYHGCGVGPLLSIEESRAVLLVRLSSLALGYSGVRGSAEMGDQCFSKLIKVSMFSCRAEVLRSCTS